MPKSDFEVQRDATEIQPWADLLDWRAASLKECELRAERAELKTKRYDELLETAKAALESGDLSALKTLLEEKIDDEETTEKDRQIAELTEKKRVLAEEEAKRQAEIDAEIAALEARLKANGKL